MNNIFNILLHTKTGMTIGIHLSEKDFKNIVKELPTQYKKQLLSIYIHHAKVLGKLPRGTRLH